MPDAGAWMMAGGGGTTAIAVLIPTLNEAAVISPVLAELRALGLREVIVADGGSADATVALAREFADVQVIAAPRGRGLQMNAAVAVSTAPILLFLHADTRLPPHASTVILDAFQDPAVVAGAFRARFDDTHPALALFASCSRFDSLLTTFGDQAYFVRRDAFDAVGGFPDWPLLEDVELRRRLRRVGRFRKVSAAVTTSARRFRARGPWRAQFENALILAAFALGVPAATLARYYHRGRRADARPALAARQDGAGADISDGGAGGDVDRRPQ